MKTTLIIAAMGILVTQLPAAPAVDWSKLPPAATVTGVTFDKDISPLFQASCIRCHGAERAKAQLRLDTLEGVMKGTKHGPILTAGDSANSLLVKAVSRLDPEIAMPPQRGHRGPRGPRGPMDTNAPAMPPPGGDHMDGGPGAGGPPMGGDGDHGPGGEGHPPGDNGGPGGRPRNFGPPPKPLTAEQVGLIRAWIDQGAK